MVVAGKVDNKTLMEEIKQELMDCEDASALLDPDEAPYLGKYDEFVPPKLVRTAFAADGLDLEGLAEVLGMAHGAAGRGATDV